MPIFDVFLTTYVHKKKKVTTYQAVVFNMAMQFFNIYKKVKEQEKPGRMWEFIMLREKSVLCWRELTATAQTKIQQVLLIGGVHFIVKTFI